MDPCCIIVLERKVPIKALFYFLSNFQVSACLSVSIIKKSLNPKNF